MTEISEVSILAKNVPEALLTEEPKYRFFASDRPPEDTLYGCRGSSDAEIMIVGESWGQEEQSMRLPFMGKSGKLLEYLLTEAGIPLDKCFFTNVVAEKPLGNDMSTLLYDNKTARQKMRMSPLKGLYPRERVIGHVQRLHNQIALVKPKLIIALGNYALWALTEDDFTIQPRGGKYIPGGMDLYRGSMLWTAGNHRIPLLPTYHPASTFRNYAWRGMIKHDLKRAQKFRIFCFHSSAWEPPEWYFSLRPSLKDAINYLDWIIEHADHAGSYITPQPIKRKFKIAVDIETRNGYIACLGIAPTEYSAMCIPFLTTMKGKKDGYWSADEEFILHEKLRELLTHPNISVTGQNFIFDSQYLANELFVRIPVGDDTMLKHHCIYPGGGSEVGRISAGLVRKSLNHLSSLYCTHHRYWKHEGKAWETSMPEEQLWTYNCQDCVRTYEVNEKLDELISDFDLEEQYQFQLEQLNKLAIPATLRGVRMDIQVRSNMQMELLEATRQFEEKLDDLLPPELKPETAKGASQWYRSPKQLCNIFYDQLGIKPVTAPGSGNPTTAKAALPIIAKREPIVKQIVDDIETLRSIGVYYGTFITADLDLDNRIRSEFNVAGTDTFRWASKKNAFDKGGNLQNIPEGDEDGGKTREELIRTKGVVFPNVRRLFLPDKGKSIADADLSGADAQVVAWETNETEWKDLLKKGIKLHSVIAEEREGFSITSGPIYDAYKRRIHATNYGGSANTIYRTLLGLYGPEHTSLDKEKAFQDYWFNRFPGVYEWHERTKKSLTDTGGVQNAFGNRIRFQDRPDDCFNKALAWVPQSTVALVCLRGGLALVDNYKPVDFLFQVHDSLVFQYPTYMQQTLFRQIPETLNSITVPYDDPLRIPWGIKTSDRSWGECTKV